MKKIKVSFVFFVLFIISSLLSLKALSQLDSNKTVIKLNSGVTKPISQNTTQNPITQSLTTCDGNDVRIFPSVNPQSEIHLSINKVNPNVLLLSSNTFPTTNSWQGAYWSTNGGTTWVGSDNLPNNAPGRGDPSTAFDAAGNGYIATMSYPAGNINAGPNGYAIQRTINNGSNWQVQTSGALVNGLDKIMVAADDVPGSPNVNNFYSVWTNFNVNNGRVEFNRSVNGGVTFSAPIGLNAHWGQGANVQTGTGGQVYVCWADYTNGTFPEQGLGFVSSTDGGQTFIASKVAFTYTGIRNGNGAQAEFNNIRVNSFPSMSVDKSTGAHRGRIYVTYAARENGNTNGRSVVQIRWSDDQGTSWSSAQTINITNGRQNWFPWVSIDDTNGNIYVVYYSLDATTGFTTNTYVAISGDGGTTFTNQRVSDAAHTTAQIAEFGSGYCGDYIGITSHGGRAYAAWYDNRSGQWQDYVSPVSNSDITGVNYICTSSNYSVTNLPANSTIAWSANPTGTVNFSCTTCAQTNITKAANNFITLTATINNVCATPLVITKSIAVGTPSNPNIFAQRLSGTCYYDLATNAPPSGTGTIIEFSGDNINWAAGAVSGSIVKAGYFLLGPTYQVQYVRTRNPCGVGPVYSKNVYIPAPPSGCQYRPITKNTSKIDDKQLNISIGKIYPNPVNKKLLIEIPSIKNASVNVYNNEGKLMYNGRLSNMKSSLNFSSYIRGLYLIKLMVNGQTKTMKIIKE